MDPDKVSAQDFFRICGQSLEVLTDHVEGRCGADEWGAAAAALNVAARRYGAGRLAAICAAAESCRPDDMAAKRAVLERVDAYLAEIKVFF